MSMRGFALEITRGSRIFRDSHHQYPRFKAAGFTPGNVDLIIHAERPNLSPYKTRIAESIAGLLDIPVSAVNVKAKTNEGLGPVGRREGIACTVTATLISA